MITEKELIARANIRGNEIKNQLWLMTVDNSDKALKNCLDEVDQYTKDIIEMCISYVQQYTPTMTTNAEDKEPLTINMEGKRELPINALKEITVHG